MRPRLASRVVACTAALALSASSAAAQSAPPPAPDTLAGVPLRGVAAILVGEAALETERGGDAAAAARLRRAAEVVASGYWTAGREPAVAREIIARAVTAFHAGRPAGPPSADAAARAQEQLLRLLLLETAQNARLVEQNDRIIQLLEAIAARRE